jgi:MscS family membrane protein
MGPFKVLRWQWVALLVLVFVAYWVGRILAWPVRFVVKRVTAFTPNQWDDALVGKLRGIAALTIMLVVTEALLPYLELGRGAQVWTAHAIRAWGLLIFFLALMRAVDVVGDSLKSASFSLGNPSARSALAIATRSAKVAVVLIGILAALLEMGYPVASILAGIGIGGLGLALAAQKTVENLFGSVSLAADEAIRLGDTVRVDTLVGSVEGIGLRSTRIRTPERTVVTIPNGLLAGQRIESLTARDRMRLHCRLALTLGTTPEQIRQVLTGCERVLRAQETLWPHDVGVRFVEIGTVSLDVEISAWFVVTWEEFTAIRQEVLLRFLEVVKEAGTSLARSTTSITVVPADPSASPEPAPTR